MRFLPKSNRTGREKTVHSRAEFERLRQPGADSLMRRQAPPTKGWNVRMRSLLWFPGRYGRLKHYV